MDQRIRRYMAKLGRKGGKVRSERMESSRRQELARLAANARWSKYRLEAKVPAATPEEVEAAERVLLGLAYFRAPGDPVIASVKLAGCPR